MHYVVESFSVMSWGVHFLQRRRITARILPTCCAFERDVASCCWLVCSWNARLFSAWMFVGYVVIFTVLKRVVCIYVSVLPSVGMLFWCRIVNETRLEVASGCAYAEFVPCFCQAVSSCCIDSFVVLPCLCFSLLLNSLLYWHLMSQVLHMKLPGVRTSQKKKKMMASVAFFCPEAVATRVLQHKRVAKYDACISTEFARLLCQWRKLTCTKTKWKVLQTFSNVTKLLFSNEKWVILAVSATLSRGVRMHSNTSQIAFDVAFYFQLIFALPCSMPELCRTA